MAALAVVGAAIRLWQYLANPSLWMDELALGHNLMTRSVITLLGSPLADDQLAPPGFLVLARAAVVGFGSSEYALRLVPFLCSLIALPIFLRVATRVLPSLAAVVAVALFSLSATLCVFAAEAKQYATDVLVTLVLTDLALGWLDRPTRGRLLGMGLAGAVLVWFSQPAAFVLVGVGGALLLASSERLRLLPILSLWAVAVGLAAAFARARMDPGLAAFMRWFWRDGFMPWPLRGPGDVFWPLAAVRDVFDLLLEFPFPTLYLVLALLGALSLLRRRRECALVLLLPDLVALAAAVAHTFPFRIRVVLFVVPSLLVFVAEGAWRLGVLLRLRPLARLLPVAAVIPPVVMLARNPPVWRFDEVRPVLAELQRQRRPGDSVYAFYPSWQALRYYGPRYGLPLSALDLGNCHPELRDYLRELDRYRGRERVWLLSAFDTHAVRELPVLLAYLDDIGVRRAVIEGPPTNRPGATGQGRRWSTRVPSFAYLYDLSDPARLASTSAETRQIPPSVRYVGVPRCVYAPIIPRVPTIR
jgi:hypothetical protein